MSFDKAQNMWKNGKKQPEGHMTAFDIDKKVEIEDDWWKLEWKIITIQGDEKCERAEYEEALNMYSALKKELKGYPKEASDERLGAVFKSKLVDSDKMKEAYEKGYGAQKDKSVQEILNEMGIITVIDWVKDYEERNNMPDITG